MCAQGLVGGEEEEEEEGEEERGRGDREWEDYQREREKRLKIMEDMWEDEDTRKRKRRSVGNRGSVSLCVCAPLWYVLCVGLSSVHYNTHLLTFWCHSLQHPTLHVHSS